MITGRPIEESHVDVRKTGVRVIAVHQVGRYADHVALVVFEGLAVRKEKFSVARNDVYDLPMVVAVQPEVADARIFFNKIDSWHSVSLPWMSLLLVYSKSGIKSSKK